MTRTFNTTGKHSARGYSLVELLISMAVLLTVAGSIFEQINQMQRKSSSEALKLDLQQQAREFVDQTVRDLHMAGYPNISMYAPPMNDLSKVANGLVSVSPSSILLEGDVNNDGNVYSVNIAYVPVSLSAPQCPCVRRGAVAKIAADSLSQPIASSYTETQNVVPPGVGPGLSGEDLFSFFDGNGNPVNVSGGIDISTAGGQTTISSIRTIKINLTLLSALRDPANGGPMGTALSGTAKVGR